MKLHISKTPKSIATSSIIALAIVAVSVGAISYFHTNASASATYAVAKHNVKGDSTNTKSKSTNSSSAPNESQASSNIVDSSSSSVTPKSASTPQPSPNPTPTPPQARVVFSSDGCTITFYGPAGVGFDVLGVAPDGTTGGLGALIPASGVDVWTPSAPTPQGYKFTGNVHQSASGSSPIIATNSATVTSTTCGT